MQPSNLVIANLANPHELEQLYRKDSEAFQTMFESAWAQHPDSPILAVWYERLTYRATETSGKAISQNRDWLVMGLFAIIAGIFTRILFPYVTEHKLAPINFLFSTLPFIAGWFIYKNRPTPKLIYTVLAMFVLAGIYLNLLPLQQTDAILLVYFHLPIISWLLLGVSFAGNHYQDNQTRINYLKFNGDFAILYAILAISGMALFGLTSGLFSLLDIHVEAFYFKNIVLVGAAALSVVAAYLVTNSLKLTRSIAPVIAKVFSPLVLATLLIYLVVVLIVGKNPFLDRAFLFTFNGVLMVILAITIFSITERVKDASKTIFDYMNAALIALALIINSIALAAIVFRLSTYGITPNRLAILGINVLIWINLISIFISYFRFLRNHNGPAPIQHAVTRFLPVYGVWALIVTVVFPILFE